MFSDILEWVKDKIRNTRIGIHNLWKWRKVVWNDRSYDYHFLLILIREKLKDMLYAYQYTNIGYMGQEKHEEQIRKCIFILNRLIDDKYNVFYFHDRKWGDVEFGSKKLDNGNYKLHCSRRNIVTEEDEKKQVEEFVNLMHHEGYLRDQDLEYLFKILRKHITSWWI